MADTQKLVAEKHLRRRAVQELTGLSCTTIYDMMKRGEFPRPIRISTRAVAWPESKIAQWQADRAKIAA
jgi:prophage regulatory protein